MKKQMHRLLSLMLSLILVVGMIPGSLMTAFAAGTGGGFTAAASSSDGWDLHIDEDGKLTWNSKGDTGEYTIRVDLTAEGSLVFKVSNVSETSYELKAEFENRKIESGLYHVYVSTTNSGYPINSGTISTYYVSGQTKLAEPQNVCWDGTVAKWSSVTGATGYTVYLYDASGSLHSKYDVTDTQRDFGAAATDGRWFEVVATADGYRNSNVAESPKYGEVVTPPATKYAINVYGGYTADAQYEYAAGETVTIVAGGAPAGQQFKEWTGTDDLTFIDGTSKTSATAKFTMPAKEVTVTATYESIPVTKYAVEAEANNNAYGTVSGAGEYAYGAEVTVIATAAEGYKFVKWTEDGAQVSTEATYKFTVTESVALVAVFEASAPAEYTITVNGGTASVGAGTAVTKATAGTVITLSVDESAIPAGKVFDKWEVVSGGVTVTDGKFTMPESAVEITATYKDAPVIPTEYDITVTGGTASANKAVAGTVITLTVDESAIPAGKVFDKWEVVSGGVTVTDGKFTMPESAVEIKATYKDAPVSHTCDIKPVAKDEPSCTEGGKEAYYKCEGCGKFYEDALGAKEITDLANWGNLPKLGHTESDWKSDKDNHWKECTVTACGVIIEDSKAAHKDDNKDGKCDVCEYNVGLPTTPDDDKPNDNPQTGDNSNMFLWIALLFISGAGVVATTVFGKKKFSVK